MCMEVCRYPHHGPYSVSTPDVFTINNVYYLWCPSKDMCVRLALEYLQVWRQKHVCLIKKRAFPLHIKGCRQGCMGCYATYTCTQVHTCVHMHTCKQAHTHKLILVCKTHTVGWSYLQQPYIHSYCSWHWCGEMVRCALILCQWNCGAALFSISL